MIVTGISEFHKWLNEPTPPSWCKEKEECDGDCCDGSWGTIEKRGLQELAPESARRAFAEYLAEVDEARKLGKMA